MKCIQATEQKKLSYSLIKDNFEVYFHIEYIE